MATDFSSLKHAAESVLGEVQKQADLIAKGLQSLAPPQESASDSTRYLLESVESIGDVKKKISMLDNIDDTLKPKTGMQK